MLGPLLPVVRGFGSWTSAPEVASDSSRGLEKAAFTLDGLGGTSLEHPEDTVSEGFPESSGMFTVP